jgi:hypothetical protein
MLNSDISDGPGMTSCEKDFGERDWVGETYYLVNFKFQIIIYYFSLKCCYLYFYKDIVCIYV